MNSKKILLQKSNKCPSDMNLIGLFIGGCVSHLSDLWLALEDKASQGDEDVVILANREQGWQTGRKRKQSIWASLDPEILWNSMELND